MRLFEAGLSGATSLVVIGDVRQARRIETPYSWCIPRQPICSQPCRLRCAGTAWSTNYQRYLNIELLKPADERCHHRLSQCRASLSPNQMWKNLPVADVVHASCRAPARIAECGYLSCQGRDDREDHKIDRNHAACPLRHLSAGYDDGHYQNAVYQ